MGDTDTGFDELLVFLQNNRGFDFTGYKRSTLGRRVAKRLTEVRCENLVDYLDYLQVHPEEFEALFNTILINVTSFFRDPEAWDFLRDEAFPPLLDSKPDDSPIRVWSAACASGEEAYSLAIMLAEKLGIEAFRSRVKIYATDIDDEALAIARHGEYPASAVASLPEELIAKYFEPIHDRLVFRSDLRRSIIFGRHDLIQDAPISRLDLLVCRNVLMYFNAETQGRILARFHFALTNAALLFLGKAEMLLTHTNLFSPMTLHHRVFTKAPSTEMHDHLLIMAEPGSADVVNRAARQTRLRELALDRLHVAEVLIDRSGTVFLINQVARDLFGLNTRDLGRPLQDLEFSYRPVELRSVIDEAHETRRPVVLSVIERISTSGERQFFDVRVTPLLEEDAPIGVSIIFEEVTDYKRLRDELERSNQDLETASELQSANEELETANEELQSTVEELETTNEELQSANEELETMNEELESTNEELQAINSELRERSDDYDHVNSFLGTVLGSLRVGVIVINRDYAIQSWNHRAEDLWGLRTEEVEGQLLFDLDIGLPVSELGDAVRGCLSGRDDYREIVTAAMNRRGRSIVCRVICTPLLDGADRQGVVLLLEEAESEVAS
jgi:two-component system, chemotaxis family, CheB/CheR fusion protein